MLETKFDVTLRSWIERAASRLKALQIKDALAKKAILLAIEALERTHHPYQQALDRLDKESEEARRAAEVVARAEGQVVTCYDALRSTCQAHYYLSKADATQDSELFKIRLDRAMPMGPAEFASLGVDRTASAMATALKYAGEEIGVGHRAVVEAQQALEALKLALDQADAEKTQAVEAMQALYAARQAAKNGYVSARRFVNGALSLEQIGESISQIMAPISDIYNASPAPPEQEREPVEA